MWAFGEKILWQRAQEYLKQHHPTLVGVTGSSGKTLVLKALQRVLAKDRLVRAIDLQDARLKSLAAAMLGSHPSGKSWWHILTGSKIGEIRAAEPDMLLLELNAQKPGDVDQISRQLPFSYAIVINAESINLDVFTSQAMVAHELMSLPASLPKEGVAALNIDDPLIADMGSRLRCKTITFGISLKSDVQLVRADRISLQGFIGQISVEGRRYEFTVQHLVSRHQLYALLAAVALVKAMNGNIQQALDAIRTLQLPPGHMNIVSGRNNSTIFDDSHGATPESMHQALKTLASLPADLPHSREIAPRRIAILGDITHLGSQDKIVHQTIGEAAARLCHVFVAVGGSMKHAQAAALKKGGVDTHHFTDSRNVGKWLVDYLKPSDIILIKGSTAMHMETIVAALRQP